MIESEIPEKTIELEPDYKPLKWEEVLDFLEKLSKCGVPFYELRAAELILKGSRFCRLENLEFALEFANRSNEIKNQQRS